MSAYDGAVVVTGASGGLGLQVVTGFLNAGVTNLACVYRSSDETLRPLFTGRGLDPAAHLFRADLAVEDEVKALKQAVTGKRGPVWGVVNLAGASSNAMAWKLTTAEFTRILNANLLSTFHTIREFLPELRERGGGRIVNTSSIVAHTGVAGAAHYCAAKAAIEGLTKAVAQEAAAKKITVNCMALGYFDQGLIRDVSPEMQQEVAKKVPLKRLGSAGEIYPLVAYLLSKEAEFMTGQVVHLNGGQYT